MPSTERMIECHEVTCRFGATVAVDGVSLGVDERSLTTIVGPSAGGKTTLLRAIAGLQPLDSGKVSIGGKLASNRGIAIEPRDRGIEFLFQEPSLWPHLSALANVSMVMPSRGISRRERRTEAEGWLERLGVGGVAKKFPGELSGGEARSVAFARALASHPRILLLDEPTAHLDLHLREGLMRRLREFHRDLNLTTLCVTHQIEPPMEPPDRVLILEAGKVVDDGPFSSVEEAPSTPFINALLRTIGRNEAWRR